ncbi:hypothetical protein BDK51DRAFT_32796 [Blyttiomyces helicus]|uniref:Uncharacterized protein n=1 Tax=Blyttiomyces helicus TaxID=388810 RepID=A0A4P9WLX8_9FUNG|nr:hypothetical protein BDK51DRAFT_32796 [Blyttiomyces helicus]|eukprot:RKO91686.1 hypothetical protein BDK51DRAFT_32796 [Blyttiomyces helicus]
MRATCAFADIERQRTLAAAALVCRSWFPLAIEIQRKLDQFDEGNDWKFERQKERARDDCEAELDHRHPPFKMNIDFGKIFSAFDCPRLKAFTLASPLPPSSWLMLSFPVLFRASADLVARYAAARGTQLHKCPDQFWESAGARVVEVAATRLRVVRILIIVEGDHQDTAYNRFYKATGPNLLEGTFPLAGFGIVGRSLNLRHLANLSRREFPGSVLPRGKCYAVIKNISICSKACRASPASDDKLVIWALENFPGITQLNYGSLVISSRTFRAIMAHTPHLQIHHFSHATNIAEVDFIKLVSVFFGKQPAFEPSRFKEWLDDPTESLGSALEHVNVAGADLTRLVCDAGLRSSGRQSAVDSRLDINEVAGIIGLD